MTTTELIELLKKYERGGATGRPREVMFETGNRIIDTDGIEATGSGDGLVTELYLSLPSAQPEITLESAIDYLHSIGWMQEHDKVLMESAQPKQKTGRWIPVTERLPEDDDPVLVTDCKWWTDIAFYDGLNWWYRDSQNIKADVSAWMPLPEPYKEKDNERA